MGRLRAVVCVTALAAAMLALSPVKAAPEPEAIVATQKCRPILRLGGPVGSTSCPGVRPGALVHTRRGYCTLNFVFRGSDNRHYIGTAGHCILASEGRERVWKRGGSAAYTYTGRRIGRVVYAAVQDDLLRDFALIRVDRGVRVNPSMCHFGGPTGRNGSVRGSPITFHHFGAGTGLGFVHDTGTWTVSARTAEAPFMRDRRHVWAFGAGIFGDSGSPFIDSDGKTIGVLVWLGVAAGTDNTGVLGIYRLDHQVKRAARVLGIRLSLRKASLKPLL